MVKTRRASRKPLYIILAFSLVVALGYAGFNYLYPPQSSQIMAITPAEISYGHTVVTGKLIKDAPLGKNGNYLIALQDMRVIYLTAGNIDGLVGSEVMASGLLSPPKNPGDPMIMVVSAIELKK